METYHPNLIITVDCGTSSVEAVKEAARLGIDVIVTDHHEPAAEGVAEACAIVNPKLGGCPEDIRMLAGVGVAFKVCHGLVKAARQRKMEAAEKLDLKSYMELVAVGTVADIVPLLKENRILVYHGLKLLNKTQSVGLRTLIEAAGITGPVDTYHIGFMIGPRINAAGRLGNAEAALELVLTEQEPRAKILAQQLDDASRKRQEIEDRIVSEACEDLDGRFDADKDFGLVVAHPQLARGRDRDRGLAHRQPLQPARGRHRHGPRRGGARLVPERSGLRPAEPSPEVLADAAPLRRPRDGRGPRSGPGPHRRNSRRASTRSAPRR